MSRRKQITAEVSISKLSPKGHGEGTYLAGDGTSREIEVPFTIPGDRVLAFLLRKQKRMMRSRLEEIIQPSLDRIEARCIHFGKCGGCRWQQVQYLQQLQWKEEGINKAFQGVAIAERHEILPSHPWHYRNKMEFTFSQDRAGERFLGLNMQAGRGKIITLSECHIGPKWSTQAIEITKRWWEATALSAYYPPKDQGTLRTLTVREGVSTGDRMVILLVSGNPDYAPKQTDLKQFVEVMDALKPENGQLSLFLRVQQTKKGQPTQFYEMRLAGPDHLREKMNIGAKEYQLMISPTAFFQPNTSQAGVLYNRAMALADVQEGDLVYDLYCGTGTLGMFAAEKAERVLGIELSPESSLDARENSKLNGCKNFTVLTGDVGTLLGQEKSSKVDLVMVDPPRVGLDAKALSHIASLQADKILYVSCNPVTQAENIRDLVAAGYQVEALQPVDQFPHTPHVECIALLKRSAAVTE